MTQANNQQMKASVEEEVNVQRSEIEKNAFKVLKLKQLVSCLILTPSSQEKTVEFGFRRWIFVYIFILLLFCN